MSFWKENATTFYPSGGNLSNKTITVQTAPDGSTQDTVEYFLVDDELLVQMVRVLDPLQLVLCVAGLLANLLTARTFQRLGLRNCLTLTFFNLAISDICHLVLNSVISIVMLKGQRFTYDTFFGVHQDDFTELIREANDLFIQVSAFLLAFLAAQRSLVIVRPFLFQNMFPRPVTLFMVACVWGYSLTSRIVWWSFTTRLALDPDYNVYTIQYVYTLPARCVYEYDQIVNHAILPSLCAIINMASLFVMTFALIKLARFRKTSPSSGLQTSIAGRSSSKKSAVAGVKTSSKTNSAITSISKDRQAIVQVAFLSVLFFLTRWASLVTNIARYINPGLGTGKYWYFNQLNLTLCEILDTINASVKFFVYYICNPRFREACFNRRFYRG